MNLCIIIAHFSVLARICHCKMAYTPTAYSPYAHSNNSCISMITSVGKVVLN